MSKNSSIEWTESTWNPITGCSKISPGCKNCYAERMAKRLKAMGQANYRNGFKITTHPLATELPLKWKKPQTIFVNSMSDIFHELVPKAFILKLFDVMNKADWHLYQILTKRSERMLELNSEIPWSKHIWMGVTVENADYKFRIDDLQKTKANVKFLSFEPLIGNVGKVNLKPKLSGFLLDLRRSLAHKGFAKILDISTGMPTVFANPYASRSQHISSQKIAQLRLKE